MHQRRRRGERHALALLAGGKTERERGMRLASAAWAQGDDVAALLDPFPACQFQHQRLVERWLGGEVESVEALGVREPGHADTTLDHPTFAIDPLEFAQPQQVAWVIGAVLRGFEGDLFVLAHERRQLERLEVVGQQHRGRHACRCLRHGGQRHRDLGHADTPAAVAPAGDSSPR